MVITTKSLLEFLVIIRGSKLSKHISNDALWRLFYNISLLERSSTFAKKNIVINTN